MTSIAQNNQNEQREIEGTLKKFFADYGIRALLKACRCEIQKERFGLSDDQLNQYAIDFIRRLPDCYQHALQQKVS